MKMRANLFVKIFAVLLSVLFMFLSFGCGCNDDTEFESPVDQDLLPEIPEQEPEYSEYGFINDGKSDYKIVIPEKFSQTEFNAANEIKYFVYESSGAELEIKKDSEVTYDNFSKFVLVGRTKFLSELGLNIPADLTYQGFVIKNFGSSIVITGESSTAYGTLYGAYEFLAKQIGFEVYAHDELYYKRIDNVNLVSMDITDKPDIPSYTTNAYTGYDSLYRWRLRSVHRTDVFGNGTISPYHNSYIYLLPTDYQKTHPEWYSTKGKQICYTARGNEESFNQMVNVIFEKMLGQYNTFGIKNLTFTLEDNYDACACEACVKAEKEYGSKSGMAVNICNILSDKFKAYFEENNINDSVNILFFAYYHFTSAPDPTKITARNNVYPIIAPYDEMDRSVGMSDLKNQNILEIIRRWQKVCKKVGLWVYSINFYNYLMPFDAFSSMQENYKFYASLDPVYVFEEGGFGECLGNGTNFNNFKEFLNCKLAWNVDADVDALTVSYFNNYFKAAAKPMYRYYEKYRAKLKILSEEYGYNHNQNKGVDEKYFELGTLNDWLNDLNDALKAIEIYKETDPDIYDKLLSRINAESVSVKYLKIKIYNSYFLPSELNEMVEDFYKTCEIGQVRVFSMLSYIDGIFEGI